MSSGLCLMLAQVPPQRRRQHPVIMSGLAVPNYSDGQRASEWRSNVYWRDQRDLGLNLQVVPGLSLKLDGIGRPGVGWQVPRCYYTDAALSNLNDFMNPM